MWVIDRLLAQRTEVSNFRRIHFQIQRCQGSAALHDIQLNQFPLHDVKFISEPIPVQHFDWSGKTLPPLENFSSTKFVAKQSGALHVVLMWWDLKMDPDNQILLSCAPYWAHPDYEQLKVANRKVIPNQNVIPWRDHWMQALYYLPAVTRVQQSDELYLNFNHDEYSLWFTATKSEQKPSTLRQPLCDCGFHNAYSRTRAGQISDNLRNKKYLKVLQEQIRSDSVVLVLSDGSLLGLSTSKLAAKVYCLESNRYSNKVLQSYVDANQLTNVHIVHCLSDIDNLDEITCVFGEPNFLSALVPWDNFYFGTLISRIKSKLRSGVAIIPRRATIHAVAVEFLDLHKIRSPVNMCEGFDLTIFDEFVEVNFKSIFSTDHHKHLSIRETEVSESSRFRRRTATSLGISMQSAQQADGNLKRRLRKLHGNEDNNNGTSIRSVNLLQRSVEPIAKLMTLKSNYRSGSCNGVALWVDWHLSDDSNSSKTTVTSGPSIPVEVDKYISWDIHSRYKLKIQFNSMCAKITFPNDSFVGKEFIWCHMLGM